MNGVGLPTIDIAPLLSSDATPASRSRIAQQIDEACRSNGFFSIIGHGLDPQLQKRLESTAQTFFDLPDQEKSEIAMSKAGSAWRGWFPVGGELTSGTPDQKEGIYFGLEHPVGHPRVVTGTALHGPNQFPAEPSPLRDDVLEWLATMRPIADAVMSAIALGLGIPADWFARNLTGDPTVLFRIFHYPAQPTSTPENVWGVGEHTDYGLLTLLMQDHHGGLQVKRLDGSWIDVAPTPGVIICNLGDMLERLTGGQYRSTPHRVRNTSGESRLSFPYFFDPSWTATVPTLPQRDAAGSQPDERWDGEDVHAWDGVYGDYLTAKVAKVFPQLFTTVSAPDTAE
ncbi:MAG: isopenicillin N synthase family oxygenase [Actinobacteria bacterium]|nr:MAG: isopenicillin N synthase family oxygenase [Actinomycetota bacterium]